MELPITQEDYTKAIAEDNTLLAVWSDELYEKATNFKFSEFVLESIWDSCRNQKFLDRLFNYSCERLNIIPDELLDNFRNINDENSEAMIRLIKDRYHRFQMVIIEFLFQYLPFNHLVGLGQDINSKKIYGIESIYNLINDTEDSDTDIRKEIIKRLYNEIQKINNIDSTLSTISEQIQQKEQVKKLNSLRNASISVSKKVINENLLIINILESCPLEKLNDLVLDILDDDLIASNVLVG